MQSPLRAALLRFLHARPEESFDIESLMQTFGRMRLDVENCVKRARRLRPRPDDPRHAADASRRRARATPRPPNCSIGSSSGAPTVSNEDRSPSVQRFREMIGRDEKMLIVFEWIRTAAKSDISVLILGPTGSGKEVVARMIHELSRRATAKFQALNCAALPDTLFESEIFGYEKGAFTGAHDRKPGRLELANNGTLFLDEIGDLSIVAQAKLLRVLEERRFERLGGNKSIDVDFRLISATNRPLEQFVRDSRFREDLYYRVNAFSIRLPSLRERAVDIPVLAQRFLARYCAANGLPLDAKTFAQRSARRRCWRTTGPATSASWRARCRAPRCRRPGATIRAADIEFLHAHEPPRRSRRASGCPRCADAERAHIVRVLEAVGWNKKEAAAHPRDQPRHALSQDRRVRARAPQAHGASPRHDSASGRADGLANVHRSVRLMPSVHDATRPGASCRQLRHCVTHCIALSFGHDRCSSARLHPAPIAGFDAMCTVQSALWQRLYAAAI